MLNFRHRWLWLLAIGISLPAFAKHKPPCRDKCIDDKQQCVKVCTDQTGNNPSALSFCKKACGEGQIHCEQKCAKKGK